MVLFSEVQSDRFPFAYLSSYAITDTTNFQHSPAELPAIHPRYEQVPEVHHPVPVPLSSYYISSQTPSP